MFDCPGSGGAAGNKFVPKTRTKKKKKILLKASIVRR